MSELDPSTGRSEYREVDTGDIRAQQTRVIVLCLLVTALVLLADLATPLGVTGGVPYVVVILISISHRDERVIYLMALLCTALTLLVFIVSPPAGELWKVIANRALATFAIWSTAILSLHHKRTLRAVWFAEKRKLDISDSAIDGIVSANEIGTIVECNSAAIKMLGTDEAGLKGRNLMDLFRGPAHTFKGPPNFAELLSSETDLLGNRVETVALRLDGTEVPVEYLMIRTEMENEVGYIVHIHDIMARTLAERSRLAVAVERMADAVVITHTDGSIQYANSAFERISGYSREEVLGSNPSMLSSGKHGNGFYKSMWETLVGGETWRGRITNKRKNGELYIEETTISPVRNAQGKTINYVATQRDMTREIELERQLATAQRMEAIGTLAGGIAHDFNNILFAIRGYADLTCQLLETDSEARSFVQEILSAEARATDLVRQMLMFSRQTKGECKPMNIAPVVKETLNLIRGSLPSTIEIRKTIRSDCLMLADPTQIHQIVMNLCTNAFHAMQENGGILAVGLCEEYVEEAIVCQCGVLKQGPYLKLSVSDTGQGMDANTLSRAFEPFFTTKEIGKGTGLGLASVYGIVTQYDGAICVDTEVGHGTEFCIYLPKCETVDRQASEEQPAARLTAGNERILFVDDEEQIVRMSATALRNMGYDVIVARNGHEALDLFLADPEEFDLIITDLTMPGLTGDKLSSTIRELRAEVPIILCTGHVGEFSEDDSVGCCVDRILKKPIGIEEIALEMRRLLDDPATLAPV